MIQGQNIKSQCAGGIIKNRDITGGGMEAKNVQGELRFFIKLACGRPCGLLDNDTITIPINKCHAPLIPVGIK